MRRLRSILSNEKQGGTKGREKLYRQVFLPVFLIEISFITFLCLLPLTACQNQSLKKEVLVYYVGSSYLEEPLQGVYLPLKEDNLLAIAQAVTTKPETDEASSALQGITCEGVSREDTKVVVTLDIGYLNLSNLQRTLANACMVLTLTALPEVSYVRIDVDGSPETGFMTADDFRLNDTVIPEVAEYQIYHIDEAMESLVSERRRFVLRDGESIERCLFDELLKFTIESNVVPVVPVTTKLISSERQGGTLILNLSREFVDDAPESQQMAGLSVSGLVYAFSVLEGVEQVKLLVQGQLLTEYGGEPLPEYLSKETLKA